MTPTEHGFRRYADVVAALSTDDLVPPPVEAGPVGSMAWLRATVSRFSSGSVHARRRALIEADLARLDPADLRAAVQRAATQAPTASHDELRRLVVRTLAMALELPDPDAVAAAVTVMAGTYFGGEDPAADAAAGWLLAQLRVAGEQDLEVAANRICLLVQACDATATLVEHARSVSPDDDAARLARALRDDPPARVMRRVAARDTQVAGVAIAKGDQVRLDIVAANRETADQPPLSFGAGHRPCPAADHALALAAGLLDRSSP